MNMELYKTTKNALDEAVDDYVAGKIECGEVPERATEILKHRLECPGQHVHTYCYWLDTNNSVYELIGTAIDETIEFCTEHLDTYGYTVVPFERHELVFIVYLTKACYNE